MLVVLVTIFPKNELKLKDRADNKINIIPNYIPSFSLIVFSINTYTLYIIYYFIEKGKHPFCKVVFKFIDIVKLQYKI